MDKLSFLLDDKCNIHSNNKLLIYNSATIIQKKF